MLSNVDGDIFGAVTRIGRDAADAAWRALDGGAWDPFCASRCLDVLLAAAGGIPSAAPVLHEIDSLRVAPLLAPALAESGVERIADAVRDAHGTVLDLILRSAATSSLLRGDYDARGVLVRFFAGLLDRAIITGRGGFLEQHGAAQCDAARALLAPVAAAAADVLLARPEAKRLGLARRHADVGPDTDLLGGVE